MKQALTISKAELESYLDIHQNEVFTAYDGFSLSNLKYRMVDRAICETNPNMLQIIPYLTLRDAESGEFYSYRRPPSGTEKRLFDLYSIGLGGHIDQEPQDHDDIILLFTREAMRELQEEVGLLPTPRIMNAIIKTLKTNNYRFIYSQATPVDEVHLGLWLTVDVDKSQLLAESEREITESSWLPRQDLEQLKLETWSNRIIPFL